MIMKLARLRTRLVRLRRRRQRLRWATAYSALGAGILATLAAAMAVDWLLNMSRVQRVILLAACVAALVWIVRRLMLPWLGVRESELDMAMLVQRHENIDSDLVAAIQFEGPEAPTWGSLELEEAVISRVAEAGRQINVDRSAESPPVGRRTLLLLACLALWGALLWQAPDYVWTFFHRLLLGQNHYPSRTLIGAITINGKQVDVVSPQSTPITVAFGHPVEFTALCDGLLPHNGEVHLTTAEARTHSLVTLDADAGQPQMFRGELARITESVKYTFNINDAFTETGEIVVVPLPVAVQELEVVPPSYAAGTSLGGRMARGLGQVSVLEGSRVLIRVFSEKPLSQVNLSIEDRRFPLRPEQEDHGNRYSQQWILDSSDTPLAAVLQPLSYQIQVIDRDGLQLEQPIEGAIRIEPDLPPRVAAAIVTPHVLPTAKPAIHYRALDDFGLGRISLVRKVIHANGTTTPDEVEIYKVASEKELQRDREAAYELDLAPLKLVKGDKLEIRVKAVDYRGPRPGQEALSEPLVFQVTDQQGILAMMLESDRLSAEQLKTMIQRQLGIGGAR
jgi:hypothetical protein